MTQSSTDPRFIPFRNQPNYFNTNRRRADIATVRSAVIIHHDESEHDGVAIMFERTPAVIFTRDQAYRIAADIADVLEHQNNINKKKES